MTTTMSEQINYVCWSADTVTATIPTEAATQSEAVLLATHSPLRVTRQRGDISGHRTSEYVTEEQILDEFLNSSPTNGVLIATVLGESGAGKSHLVRWMDANITETPHRHVIYLQKTETSLKDVIEKLLLNQTDPEFDEIRGKLSSLGAGMTQEEMEQRILLELAEVLRTLEADTPLARTLVGDNGLRLFFLDPLFRDHLLRPDSFIKRRARYSLYGRDESEPDVPLEFTTAELPTDIGDYANIGDAAAATRKIFGRLSNPTLQTEAVRLLNKVLDTAVTKAASLNVGDVSQAFKRIREKFVGHEIVLLIEDVALIQGVRRDLLDAIVEVGVVQGVEKYATVRTMMAVTPGYYQKLPDTFRTRAEGSSPTYRVEVDLDANGVEEQDFVDFFGRYLNAARVGRTELEKSAPSVPNACSECQFQAPCHTAFGASGQGYGLYPYNQAALIRAVRACADTDGERIVFNPRRVLARAVRDVLTDNIRTIRDGVFPPAALLRDESARAALPFLPTQVRERIENAFPDPEAGRIETLLTFWGREGTEQIDAGVLRAFSQQPIPSDLVDRTKPGSDPVRGPDKGKTRGPDGTLPPSLRKDLEDVDAWSTGTTLPQGLANDLRSIVREALLARVQWFDTVIKEPTAETLKKAVPENARGVSIEGANENINAEPVVRLSRDARTAMMFRGLLFIRAGLWQQAGPGLPRLDQIVSEHVDEAKRRILDVLAVDEDSLVKATASLIKGAAACGHLPRKAADLDYINAALWDDPTTPRADNAARSPNWQAAYNAYVSQRKDVVKYFLSAVGPSQGVTGAVYAVAPYRMTLIVRKAKVLAASNDEIDVPSWCKEAHRKLKELTRATDSQLEYWQSLLDRIRKHLPTGVTLIETIDATSEATRTGQSHGYVKVRENLASVLARNEDARSWDQSAMSTITRLVESAKTQSGLPRLSTVGTDAGADLPAIADYLDYSANWIEAGIASAEADTGTTADIDEQVMATITQWFATIEETEPHG
ncbi:protein DpdH [Rhodococcus sp. NPDC058505]|uniref:protein DpdH n=1 Tax=unclassified Rhodococcus (in: high G+C Gram-positive bacteria) TaxID=192944 RepID=UPI00365BE5B2